MLTLLPSPAAPTERCTEADLTGRLSLIDHAATRREGWEVVECGHEFEGGLRVQLRPVAGMADGSPCFAADHDVLQSASRPVPPGDRHRRWEHVVHQARTRSQLHRAALDAVDDTERMLIEAACGCW